MSLTWRYPLYLIPHGGGFVAMVDSAAESEPVHLLVVHTEREAAVQFMEQVGVVGEPRALGNDREFRWLLLGLRHPVTQVTFDPAATIEAATAARWRVTVKALLEEYLAPDNSPWNYPVFVIAQQGGFASIQGVGSSGETLTAVGLFTREDKALAYLEAAGEEGTLCELANLDEARTFLAELAGSVMAVALDPVVDQGRRTAAHCFSLRTLQEKYLVRVRRPEPSREKDV